MTGRAVVTSAYLVAASEPVLIETGPTTSVDAVTLGLRSLGVGERDLAHIVVTHIHLDHAGGVGTLAARFPKATVWVHERGAPHLQDPSKLLASAGRVYGEQRLRGLFGPMDPVPADRLRSVADGDTIPLGDRTLEVLYTPGHASHHISLVESGSGALWTGDALGIHLPDVGVLRPATSTSTPPPRASSGSADAPRPSSCSATTGQSARWTRCASSPPHGGGSGRTSSARPSTRPPSSIVSRRSSVGGPPRSSTRRPSRPPPWSATRCCRAWR